MDSNKVDIGDKGTIELSGGVLQLIWKPGAHIEVGDVSSAVAAISALGRGAQLPLLIQIRDVTHSVAARKIFPDPASVSRMALVGFSAVDQVVAMFRLPLSPIGFPVRFFSSTDKALAWLGSP